MSILRPKKLEFHPVAEMFASSMLNAEFLSKAKYKQIANFIQESYQELALAIDVKTSSPSDARARAYAVSVGNDKFCESNDFPLSMIELTAEMVNQTLKRLVFVRSVQGAVYKDQAFAFKAPKTYGDISQDQYNNHVEHLKVFSNVQDMLALRNFSAKNVNEDIVEACNKALSACLFLLKQISEARFSASRSNQIFKMIQEAKGSH